jgi:serine/threonine-protein kinase
MGVVYEAQDPQIGRVVAIKVLRQDRASNEALVKRFLREAKAIGRLSHPHIVRIYDAGEERGDVYIAMEFVEGRPLNDVVRERPLTLEETLEIGVQVADTLHYAHEQGVVHRDIKPSNIIFQPDTQIKITDFGIARIEDSTATLQTQMGEMMGTPAYMSPEQVLGKPVDGRTDIFSLGVVLYELSTGKRPFGGTGATLANIFNEIVNETPSAPASSSVSGSVPAGLSTIIMKCLKKSADQRYQTGLELATALRRELAGLKKSAASSLGSPEPKERGRPTSSSVPKALLWILVVLGAVASGIGIYRYAAREKPPPPAAVGTPAPSLPETERAAPLLADKSPAPQPEPPRPAPEERRPPAPPPSPEKVSVRGTPAERPGKPESETRRPPKKADLTIASTPVKVMSTPEGASISIDGRAVGRAPAIFMVSVGKHRVRAAHAGYRDAETEVDVHETMEYPLRLILEPAE